MNTTTARARTRGKSPVEFTFEGYGVAVPRNVKGKDGKDLVGEDGKPIIVDDLDVTSIVYNEDGSVRDDAFDNALSLHGGNIGKMLEAAFNVANLEARKAASPTVETDTDDELTPIINVLIEHDILSRARVIEGKAEPLDEVRNWRRVVSTGSKALEMDVLDYAKMTKEYKTAIKVGASFPTE